MRRLIISFAIALAAILNDVHGDTRIVILSQEYTVSGGATNGIYGTDYYTGEPVDCGPFTEQYSDVSDGSRFASGSACPQRCGPDDGSEAESSSGIYTALPKK